MHARARTVAILAVLVVLAAACGPGKSGASTAGAGGDGAGGDGAGGEARSLTIVHGAPVAAGSVPEHMSFAFNGYASAAGMRGNLTVVGTGIGVYEAAIDAVTALPLVGSEPDLASETGHVYALAAYDDGIVVAAENGLFFAKNGVLTRSGGHDVLHPLGLRGMTARIADEDADEDDKGSEETHLTLRTVNGLYELEPGELRAWTIADESGMPSAAFAQRDVLFAAWGSRLYEVDKAAGLAELIALELGDIHEIACATQACAPGTSLYFATDRGLVERSPAGEYTRYTLAAEGQPGVRVATFALDGKKSRLYAVTEAEGAPALVRIMAGALPEEVTPLDPSTMANASAADGEGNMWVFTGGTAKRFATGKPLGFASDIAPIFGEYCSTCHGEGIKGAPTIDYSDYDVMLSKANIALKRITDGSMPPPNNPPMPKEQAQLFVDWLATKAP